MDKMSMSTPTPLRARSDRTTQARNSCLNKVRRVAHPFPFIRAPPRFLQRVSW
jgi:hypothetical protein